MLLRFSHHFAGSARDISGYQRSGPDFIFLLLHHFLRVHARYLSVERKVNDKIYFVKIHTFAKLLKIYLHVSNFAEGFNFNYYYAIFAYQKSI